MFKTYKSLSITFLCYIILTVIALVLNNYTLIALLFWGLFIILFMLCSKNSILQTTSIEKLKTKDFITIFIVFVLLSILLIAPMGLTPTWNGRQPAHRDQYERLADSIMNGHLYIEYDDYDVRLEQMENPYDYRARIDEQIPFHWDHAFYNGHYYMYFGVVPVFLLFIPFKLIFGKTLVTFHATQFFVFLSIIAFFILFYKLARRFFPKISLGTYLFSVSAVLAATIGYCTQAPALYCTAISGGFCLMLWSILFYFHAVYDAKKEVSQVIFATLGALCGALAFGCRPPVALANIVAIPLAIVYAKNYKGKVINLIRNFAIIALPYVIVAVLLMLYNYARFENPFEFGQSYQLTSSDQTIYLSFFDQFNLPAQINLGFKNFFELGEITAEFPYVNYGGFLVTYPLMWLMIPFVAQDNVRKSIKNDGTDLFVASLFITTLLTTFAAIQFSPGIAERYRLDSYYILGIATFIVMGYRLKTKDYSPKVARFIQIMCVLTIFLTFLQFLRPLDGNYTAYYPEKLEFIKDVLFFKSL
ncbi:MAG: hypothetical protein K6D96_10575 [Acetatifactor sp.]|nr:hypothetical protein [Acetatifactor sp.]